MHLHASIHVPQSCGMWTICDKSTRAQMSYSLGRDAAPGVTWPPMHFLLCGCSAQYASKAAHAQPERQQARVAAVPASQAAR